MKKIHFYVIACLIWTLSFVYKAVATNQTFYHPKTDTAKSFIIAGYLANYSFDKFNFSALPYLNRIYYFAVSPSEDGQFFISSEDSSRLLLLKSKLNKDQQLYLVIGGWTQSKNIPAMAGSTSKQRNYINAVVKFCKSQQIDGVDLDWEDYPIEVDAEKYVALTKEFSTALHKNGIGFTVALGIPEKKLQLAVKIQSLVDEINLMSYGKFDAEGNQATAYLFEKWLTDYSNAGIKKEKLIVGVPFYGKRLPDTTNQTPIALTYAEIINRTHPAPSVNNYGKYSYNGKELIERKVKHLLQNGYRGIMAWELSQDMPVGSDTSLLKTIYNIYQVKGAGTSSGK